MSLIPNLRNFPLILFSFKNEEILSPIPPFKFDSSMLKIILSFFNFGNKFFILKGLMERIHITDKDFFSHLVFY